MDFQAHEQRVVQERNELSEKLEKLKSFIPENPIFKTLPFRDKELLCDQRDTMEKYLTILNERIGRFVK